jgi:predicted thioesterase/catechol 2,3-dioxygenase-like lactoylglutathione lyase family enzyme
MKPSLAVGLSMTQTYLTTMEMRARQLATDVFSTPAMISLMERTCTQLTAPHLDDHEQTVGMHIDVRHLAPTRIGQSVTITAEIIQIDRRRIRYTTTAVNDNGVKIGEGTQWRAVVDTTKFAETQRGQSSRFQINGMAPLLSVFNMPRALAFYRDTLGFEVVSDSGKGDQSSWVWLRLAGVDLMLNDQYEPGHEPATPPPERSRWHKDTCLYFGCPDPDAAYEFLKSKGVQLGPPEIASYGMKQLYFQDPDGYNLCLQCPVEKRQ